MEIFADLEGGRVYFKPAESAGTKVVLPRHQGHLEADLLPEVHVWTMESTGTINHVKRGREAIMANKIIQDTTAVLWRVH